MRVGVLGINHKLANLDLRDRLAQICQRRIAPGQFMSNDHSLVLLSTCNRTEVYFSSEDLAETHSHLLSILRYGIVENFDQKLYSYFGYDCLQHLCRVTSGLDSAIVAETEIQGQVKIAYEAAQAYSPLPSELHSLFQKGLSIAKKVRAVLPTKPGLPDIEHAIYQTGQHFFAAEYQPKILFVGASNINEKILSYVKGKYNNHITLCNRSFGTGRNFAEKYQVPQIDWDHLAGWHQYDWIVLGTKCPTHLITHESDFECETKKLIIDLSVPRNVDPSLACHPKITLLNIDQINRRLKFCRRSLSESLGVAEEIVSTAIQYQVANHQKREHSRLQFCISA
jgi:glutamyl-tRNA reductase